MWTYMCMSDLNVLGMMYIPEMVLPRAQVSSLATIFRQHGEMISSTRAALTLKEHTTTLRS